MQTSVLALALALSAGASHAATLTFDSLVEYMPEDFTWTEQGFYGDPSMYDTPGEGTIHGPGGPAWPSATIQRDSLFTPLSIDVAGHGGLNEGPQDWEGEIEPFDNLMFEGLMTENLSHMWPWLWEWVAVPLPIISARNSAVSTS